MPTIIGSVQRLELNQSSRVPTKEQLSGDKLILWQGLSAKVECAIFKDDPSASSILDVTDLDSVNLVVRKTGPNGNILFTKEVTNFTPTSYSDWIAEIGKHFVFDLDELDTTQIVPDSGRLPIYFVVTAVTNAMVPYIAGFGYGEIVDVGFVENPVSSDYITGRTPIVGGKLLTDFDLNGHNLINSGDIYTEEGSVVLTGGQLTVNGAFTFTKLLADGYRFDYLYIKDVTGIPRDVRPFLQDQTTIGFTVQLTASATAGSILYWKVIPKVNLPSPLPAPRFAILPVVGANVRWNITDMGGQVYNVLAYQIFGDGVTDNTIKLQALIDLVYANGGGVIFFPPGNYKHTGVTIIGDSITLEGCGFTTRIWNTSTSSHTFQFGSVVGAANYGKCLNMRFHPTVTRASGAYEIFVHSGQITTFDSLNFYSLWGGIKLGRVDALQGDCKITNIQAHDFHQFFYTMRFQDVQCSKWVLGAVQSDAMPIIVEGGCDCPTFTSVQTTNGGAGSVWIRASDYSGAPSRFVRFTSCAFDHPTNAIRQDNADFTSYVGCDIHSFVINGGANTTFIGGECYNSSSHGGKIFGGGFVGFQGFIFRGCQGDGLQILNNFVGGVSITGGKFEGCTGNGLFIATGVTDVFLSKETHFTGNAVDITNNSTSATVLLPERFMTWTAIPLSNSWTSIGAPYFLAQYARGSTGFVQLRGVVHNGTFTYPTIIGTLPVGFRPASNMVFTVPFGAALGAVQVGADGTIRVNVAGPDNEGTFLDGISFLPA